MHLVLIETSGNQPFIFASNRLRENVGASELVHRAGTVFVREACEELGLQVASADAPAETTRRAFRWVQSISGRSLLLVPAHDAAVRLVRAATTRALLEAPGLDLRGAVGPAIDLERDDLGAAVRDVAERLARTRASVPRPAARFLRLPFHAPCATSGLPAGRSYRAGESEKPADRSEVAIAKSEAANKAFDRLRAEVGETRFATSIDALEREFEELDWIGVVHADGNGVGRLFLELSRAVGGADPATRNRGLLDALGALSRGLARTTRAAFAAAAAGLPVGRRRRAPMVPLVLGGADVPAIVDGRHALRFAVRLLRAFERESEALAGEVPGLDVRRLGACAGVAIVKPHFPFHAAYELAESLLASAKGVKARLGADHSAVDYHVLYDSSSADLERIRGALRVEPETLLTARPYVVTPSVDDAWARPRSFDALSERAAAIEARGPDGERALPNGLLHELRGSLFHGRAGADARLRLELPRHEPALAPLLPSVDPPTLFHAEPDGAAATGFLDALEASEFLRGASGLPEDDG